MRSVVPQKFLLTGGGRLLGSRQSGASRYGAARSIFNALAALLLGLSVACAPAGAAEKVRILAFGDSLTAGYGLAPEDSFPARLQARLVSTGIGADIINGGVSGDTTAGGLARLDWALADKPDFVILELGANDALRGIDPKVTRANLDKMLAKIKASGAGILLIGMYSPPNWGRDYQEEFNAIYPELARKYDVPLYPFFLDGVAMKTELNQADGMHPNPRGVEIMAERVAPLVKKMIEEAKS